MYTSGGCFLTNSTCHLDAEALNLNKKLYYNLYSYHDRIQWVGRHRLDIMEHIFTTEVAIMLRKINSTNQLDYN